MGGRAEEEGTTHSTQPYKGLRYNCLILMENESTRSSPRRPEEVQSPQALKEELLVEPALAPVPIKTDNFQSAFE